jgi:hypothetical protein
MKNELTISRDTSGTVSFPTLSDGSTVLHDVVNSYGYLIPYGDKVTLSEFATLITDLSTHEIPQEYARLLNNIVKMTLVVYKNDKALKEDMVYEKSFAVANIDNSEAYAIALIKGDSFTRLKLDNADKALYSQLKTPDGGNFLAGHLSNAV